MKANFFRCIVLFISLFTIHNTSQAQTQSYLTLGADTIAVYDSDTLWTCDQQLKLTYTLTGAVYNDTGDSLYSINSSMEVLDMNGDLVGSIALNGNVLNSNQDVIGSVLLGVVKDANGDTLGNYGTMPTNRAALYYFFALAYYDM